MITEAVALFDVDAGAHHDHDQRPSHYLLVTRDEDDRGVAMAPIIGHVPHVPTSGGRDGSHAH